MINEPLKRAYLWELAMPSLIGGIDGLRVSEFAQDIKLGNYNITESPTIKWGPLKQSFAGEYSIEDMVISFLSPSTGIVEAYIHSWHRLMVSELGHYYPKNNYSKDIYIRLLDMDGSELAEFRCAGCFPKTRPGFGLSYASDTAVKYDIVFNVDQVYTPDDFMGLGVFGKVLGKFGALGKIAGQYIPAANKLTKNANKVLSGSRTVLGKMENFSK